MDGGRFDRLTKAVAWRATRRGVFRGLARGAFAAGLGQFDRGDAAAACRQVREACATTADCCARSRCEGTGRCAREGRPTGNCQCRCNPGLKNCDGRCRNTLIDPKNCGGCGSADPDFVCGADQACQDGACVDSGICPGGEAECESAPGVGTGVCCDPLKAPCCAQSAPGGGFSFVGCRCTAPSGARGCEVNGACCVYGFDPTGACFCAESGNGCGANRGCRVGGACDYCCSGRCDAVPGFEGGVCR